MTITITRDMSQKELLLRRYFAKKPPSLVGPAILLILGLLWACGMMTLFGLSGLAGSSRASDVGSNLISGLMCGAMCAAPGLLLVLIGGILMLQYNSQYKWLRGPKPSDQQVDSWFRESMQRIVGQSLGKIGLDPNQIVGEPLPITGPILWTTTGVPNTDLVWKVGEDGVARFGVYRVTVIHLAEHLLGSYACDFNFLKDVTLNESTYEFHYRDVVSVSTQEISTSYTLPTGEKLLRAQAFKLSVASGESIEVALSSEQIQRTMPADARLPETGAERAVQTIRTMLREKKA